MWTQTSFLGPVSSLHFRTLHLAFVFSYYWSVSLLIFASSPSPQGIQSTHYLAHSPASAFLPRLVLVFFFLVIVPDLRIIPFTTANTNASNFSGLLSPTSSPPLVVRCFSLFLVIIAYFRIMPRHSRLRNDLASRWLIRHMTRSLRRRNGCASHLVKSATSPMMPGPLYLPTKKHGCKHICTSFACCAAHSHCPTF